MNVLLSCVIIVAAAVLAALGILLVRRRAPEGSWFKDGDRAAGVFGVLATGFAVLLGFIVYLAYTSYDTARSGAESEATDVIQQYETAQFLPRNVRLRLAGELVCYGRSVIHVEWPALRAGEKPLFNPWGPRLFETLGSASPVTNAEQAAYSKWLDETTDREQARLDRVGIAYGVIPGPLWFILLVTSGLVLVYVFFFADSGEAPVVQMVLAGTVTAMLVASLLVIRFLDDPYHPGFGSLQPVVMQRTLDQIDQANKILGLRVSIPCDAAGKALS